MSDTTNWGDVEQDIVARLKGTPRLRGAASASSEKAADDSIKTFPWAVVIWDGAFTVDAQFVNLGVMGELVRSEWAVLIYTSSGRSDPENRYGTDGTFAMATAIRERLLGYSPPPEIQKGGSQLLTLISESNPEPYGGTGGLKIRMVFTLTELFVATPS